MSADKRNAAATASAVAESIRPAPSPRTQIATEPVPGAEPARVCPHFHAAVELVGKRWTGAILWALIERPHYFAELTAAIPGLSDKLASQRLRELEQEGIVERCVHPGSPARVSYALSEKGRALAPAIAELRDWARRWQGSRDGVPSRKR